MTMNAQFVVSILMLGSSIWVLLFLLPKARREGDKFAVICLLLTAFVGLIGWLFLGIGTR